MCAFSNLRWTTATFGRISNLCLRMFEEEEDEIEVEVEAVAVVVAVVSVHRKINWGRDWSSRGFVWRASSYFYFSNRQVYEFSLFFSCARQWNAQVFFSCSKSQHTECQWWMCSVPSGSLKIFLMHNSPACGILVFLLYCMLYCVWSVVTYWGWCVLFATWRLCVGQNFIRAEYYFRDFPTVKRLWKASLKYPCLLNT